MLTHTLDEKSEYGGTARPNTIEEHNFANYYASQPHSLSMTVFSASDCISGVENSSSACSPLSFFRAAFF